MREIRIRENESGQRLDKFLAKYMGLAPKSFFYKMMRKKNIVLNGKKAQGSEQLRQGDVVKLFLSDETIEKFTEKQGIYRKRALESSMKTGIRCSLTSRLGCFLRRQSLRISLL